jgi:hypothetical protein
MLLRQEFSQRKLEAEERGRSGELGPVGVRKALKALAAEFEGDLKRLAGLIDIGEKYHADLRAKLPTREVSPSRSPDEAVERAFVRHRVIQRFEYLASDQRREAIRILDGMRQ